MLSNGRFQCALSWHVVFPIPARCRWSPIPSNIVSTVVRWLSAIVPAILVVVAVPLVEWPPLTTTSKQMDADLIQHSPCQDPTCVILVPCTIMQVEGVSFEICWSVVLIINEEMEIMDLFGNASMRQSTSVFDGCICTPFAKLERWTTCRVAMIIVPWWIIGLMQSRSLPPGHGNSPMELQPKVLEWKNVLQKLRVNCAIAGRKGVWACRFVMPFIGKRKWSQFIVCCLLPEVELSSMGFVFELPAMCRYLPLPPLLISCIYVALLQGEGTAGGSPAVTGGSRGMFPWPRPSPPGSPHRTNVGFGREGVFFGCGWIKKKDGKGKKW